MIQRASCDDQLLHVRSCALLMTNHLLSRDDCMHIVVFLLTDTTIAVLLTPSQFGTVVMLIVHSKSDGSPYRMKQK